MKDLTTFTENLPLASENPTIEELCVLSNAFFTIIDAEPQCMAEFYIAHMHEMNNHVSAWVSGFNDIWDEVTA